MSNEGRYRAAGAAENYMRNFEKKKNKDKKERKEESNSNSCQKFLSVAKTLVDQMGNCGSFVPFLGTD